MEAESIFPVFGELHADDPLAVLVPCERPARKVYANTAKLFVVSAEQAEQSEDERESEDQTQRLKVTRDLPVDTATALQCLAFLLEFFNCLEPGDLRQLADLIGVRL